MIQVSIIIPHYNSTELLEKLISTIPEISSIQTIVVDDHSNEFHKNRLMEIEQANKNRNILFLTNDLDKKNAGSSRNKGLKHAKGKWVLFADSDDYFVE